MSRIVVVGSLHYDMIVSGPRLPRLGETLPGSGWESKCGGKGRNQAAEAARHGGTVAMVGCVGDDDMGRQLVGSLRQAGVDAGLVRAGGVATGLSVVIAEAAGDYAAVIVSGANQDLDERDVAAAANDGAAVLVLQNEIPDAINLAAARRFRAAGSLVLLNAAPARAPLDALYRLVDVLVVNAIEAEMLGAEPVADLASAERAACALAALAPVVIVTAGGDGVAVRDAHESWVLAPHRVALVSTHGAGDAFVGALAAQLATGQALRDAVVYANAAAAVIVSTPEPRRAALDRSDTARLLGAGG